MRNATHQDVVSPQTGRHRPAVRRWLGLGLDLVFPPLCANCQEAIEPCLPSALCPVCRAALVVAGPSCPRCGLSLPMGGDPQECPKCARERFRFNYVARLGTYDGALRGAVLRIKRPQTSALAVALGELLAEMSGSSLAALEPDVVVPVPMHWTRKLWRGANCPDIIARRLADHLGVPLRGNLLTRRRRTVPQASLSPSRRRANVRGAFRAASHPDLPGARILLVDDIMTTGATVNEAAKTLAKAGAAFVAVVVLARAEGLA